MQNFGVPFSLTNPSASGGGGGGGTPTITVDTTINVPTDQPTIAAAIAWIQARLIINGAVVTINIESALLPTINEQLVIDSPLPSVRFTNDGPVNVDSTGFIPTAMAPIPVFLFINNDFGDVSGTWIKTAGGPCIGYVCLNTLGKTGDVVNAYSLSISGFFFDIIALSGTLSAYNTSCGPVIAQDADVFWEGTSTISGKITAQNGSKVITGNNVNLYSTDNSIILSEDGSLVIVKGNLSVTHPTPNIPVAAQNGGKIVLSNVNLTVDATGAFPANVIAALKGGEIEVIGASFSFLTLPMTTTLVESDGGSKIVVQNSNGVLEGATLDASDSTVLFSGNSWDLNHNGTAFVCANSEVNVNDTLNLNGVNNPALASVQAGKLSIIGTVVGGPSAGARFTVSAGGVVSSDFNPVNWGADSQLPLVPTANGLILAP